MVLKEILRKVEILRILMNLGYELVITVTRPENVH